MSKLVRIRLFLLSIAGMIFCAVLFCKATVSTPKQIFDLYYIPYTQVQENGAYYTQELFIIDSFAHIEDSSTQYYLAVFFDANDDAVAVNFVTKKSDPIYSQLNRYQEDDSQQIGDCVLNCYVKASANTMSNSSETKELKQYFNEAVEAYEQALEMRFQQVDLRFSYLCDSSEDPQQALAQQSRSMLLGATLILVVSLLALFAAVLIRPKTQADPSLEIPMAAASPSSPATINSSQLANLETLHNAGILTDEEYNDKLRQLNNP